MKTLNICIDIDGTITDPYFWLNSANTYFNKNLTVDEITQYDISKAMGIPKSEYIDFYNKNKFRLHGKEEHIRKDAKRVIQELIEEHNIYFVTARDKDLEILTHHYLKKNCIPYDNVFVLGTTYKVDMAKKLSCDIFIEDSYENSLQLSQSGFKVLLMNTNYNQMELDENITRVFNWEQIHDIIDKMLLHQKTM
ncbi:hypothetical protein ACYUJ6_01220 [Clostridium sp. JNZ X4-2]